MRGSAPSGPAHAAPSDNAANNKRSMQLRAEHGQQTRAHLRQRTRRSVRKGAHRHGRRRDVRVHDVPRQADVLRRGTQAFPPPQCSRRSGDAPGCGARAAQELGQRTAILAVWRPALSSTFLDLMSACTICAPGAHPGKGCVSSAHVHARAALSRDQSGRLSAALIHGRSMEDHMQACPDLHLARDML